MRGGISLGGAVHASVGSGGFGTAGAGGVGGVDGGINRLVAAGTISMTITLQANGGAAGVDASGSASNQNASGDNGGSGDSPFFPSTGGAADYVFSVVTPAPENLL